MDRQPRPVPSAGIVRWEYRHGPDEPWWWGIDRNDSSVITVFQSKLDAVLAGRRIEHPLPTAEEIIRLAWGPCEHGGQWTLLEDREREVEARELKPGMRYAHGDDSYPIVSIRPDGYDGWLWLVLDGMHGVRVHGGDLVIIDEPGGRHLHPCDECALLCERCGDAECFEEECRAMERMVCDTTRGTPDHLAYALQTDPRAYRIPAREVVPGMLMKGRPITRVWIDTAQYPGEARIAWCTATGIAVVPEMNYVPWPPDDEVLVALPGPSPRELCCTCGTDWGGAIEESWQIPGIDPDDHGEKCPVAPRTGVHGGMRLWPALAGPVTSWHWADGMWWADWDGREEIHRVSPAVVAQVGLGGANCAWFEVVLQAFFLPPRPAPEPDRRPPVDVDPELACAFARWP